MPLEVFVDVGISGIGVRVNVLHWYICADCAESDGKKTQALGKSVVCLVIGAEGGKI